MPRHEKVDQHLKKYKNCPTAAWFTGRRGKKPDAKFDTAGQNETLCTDLAAWAEVEKDKIKYENISGPSGNHTFVVTCEGADPEKCVVHIRTVPEDLADVAQREADAAKAIADAELGPKRLTEGKNDFFVESWAGTAVAKEKTHTDFAELLAGVHKVEPAWFDAHKEKLGETYECTKEANPGSPGWWFATHPVILKEFSEDQVKDLFTECPEPLSEAGKKVVTCHGDFHKGNVLQDSEGKLQVIDCEWACAGWAALDIAYHFSLTPHSTAQKKEFVQAYTKAMGVEEEVPEETDKLLYDIEMMMLRSGFMSVWLTTENLKKSNKKYAGEVFAGMKEFEARCLEDAELQAKVIANGAWIASLNEPKEDYKKAFDKWGKLYTSDGKSCCACTIF